MSNLKLWDAVQATDPKYTKQFSRGGGFKGTATNATYLAKKATEQFGPIGYGWGLDVIDEQIIAGHPHLLDGQVIGHDTVHKVHVKFWYLMDGKKCEFQQFGQTQMVGKNKNGFFTDEEAPKKSMTDAMSKCLSLLGFSADIHLGLYDDNKYVSGLQEQFSEKITEEQRAALQAMIEKTGSDIAAFVKYLGVDSLAALPASSYQKAMSALEKKAKAR
jgi:hypothetical protein